MEDAILQKHFDVFFLAWPLSGPPGGGWFIIVSGIKLLLQQILLIWALLRISKTIKTSNAPNVRLRDYVLLGWTLFVFVPAIILDVSMRIKAAGAGLPWWDGGLSVWMPDKYPNSDWSEEEWPFLVFVVFAISVVTLFPVLEAFTKKARNKGKS